MFGAEFGWISICPSPTPPGFEFVLSRIVPVFVCLADMYTQQLLVASSHPANNAKHLICESMCRCRYPALCEFCHSLIHFWASVASSIPAEATVELTGHNSAAGASAYFGHISSHCEPVEGKHSCRACRRIAGRAMLSAWCCWLFWSFRWASTYA